MCPYPGCVGGVSVSGFSGTQDYLNGNYIKQTTECNDRPQYHMDTAFGNVYIVYDTQTSKWVISTECGYAGVKHASEPVTSDAASVPPGVWLNLSGPGSTMVDCYNPPPESP